MMRATRQNIHPSFKSDVEILTNIIVTQVFFISEKKKENLELDQN